MSATRDILDAVELAALHHGDQRYGRHPYVVHPLAVAGQVAERGGSRAQVLAAILHDTVKDTDLTVRQIQSMFGPEVAVIVSSLTHDLGVPYDRYVDELHPDAVLVKLCDSICNLVDLPAAEMTVHRRRRLTARYEANVAKLTERLR